MHSRVLFFFFLAINLFVVSVRTVVINITVLITDITGSAHHHEDARAVALKAALLTLSE